VIRVGTRGSALARAQAAGVAAALAERLAVETSLVEVRTHGDQTGAPLTSLVGEGAGPGVFVGALREALVAGEVDIAVHSLKDLPTQPCDDVTLAAVPAREDPRDVVVAREGLTLGELPPGSQVGTGSPRRAAQLQALGLGLEVVPVRGNVDTRLRKVADGELDAVVLARAGLARLGRLGEVTEVLNPLQMLPAPGQGALAVECRADDADLAERVRGVLDDPPSRAAVTAERGLLAGLEAGCTAPVGALAEVAEGDDGDELWLRAVVLSADGALSVRRSLTGVPEHAAKAGAELAAELLADGAGTLDEPPPPAGPTAGPAAERSEAAP
jgi:hydroxymethylbilane synthase